MNRYTLYTTALFSISGLLSAQNILNNSGFEYGLMCYQTNVWSGSGVFGRGDYQFRLSPDAHSGLYSLEIGCSGGDCFKAAVYSGLIPTAPLQTYKLTAQVKCPIGATATIFVPNTAQGDRSFPMNCTGNWTPNTVTFQTASDAHDFFFYLFSYGGQFARFDDVVLTYGDGTAPPALSLHSGNRDVRVSSQAVVVDGSPYLALGFFDVNYADLAQLRGMGANTVFALGANPSAVCFNTTQRNYQDRAYELGLNFVPESSSTARLGVAGVFPGLLQQFGPHLANIAWMQADEPDQSFVPFWYVNPGVFTGEYAAAKTRTNLPLFGDFQRAGWSVTSDVAPYASGVDMFMAEPYGSDFSTTVHAANMFKSLGPAKPVWMAQDNIDAPLIVPKAYWLLLNGVTGIAYFNWDYFKAEPAKLAAAQQVFGELNQLKPVLFSQNIDQSVTASGGVGSIARFSNGSTYILAVNPNPQNVQANFQMSGVTAGQQIHLLFENRTITATAGGFTDAFAGVARHVYVVDGQRASISGNLLTKAGADNLRDWKIQIANAGPSFARSASITSAALTVTGGKFCQPTVLSAFPVIVGDIAPASAATGDLLINFTGCDGTSKINEVINLSANAGAATNSIVRNNDRK